MNGGLQTSSYPNNNPMPGKTPTLYALLVAINDYPMPVPRLKGCLNDLHGFKAYLESFCRDQGITFRPLALENNKATRQNIIDGFRHFGPAGGGDFCLFFFAGHGSRGDANAAFHHLKASEKQETLVCYDSRPGGRDLTDKELSFLIWQASQGRNLHFTVITDCCHSGSVTRLAEEVRVRQVRKSPKAMPVEEFLGFESYTLSTEGRYSPPRGRYVHLGAALPFELAREVKVKGKPHGAFTACLLEALAGARGRITYAELANRVAVRMRTMFTDQSPQLEATLPTDKNLFFLSSVEPRAKGQYLVGYDKARGWIVNAGALHGLETGQQENRTVLRLENGHRVFLSEALPDYSRVEPMKGYDELKAYPATVEIHALPKVILAFSPDSEPQGKVVLAPILRDSKSGLFRLTDDATQAGYHIHARSQSYALTSSYDLRPLFKPEQGYSRQAAERFAAQIEAVAGWARLLGQSNPDTSILDTEIEVELYRITQANNYEDSAPAEMLSLDTEVEFPYLFDGTAWREPAFQMKIKNNSHRRLWVSLLYLGGDFSVTNQLVPKEPLEPGQETWAKDVYENKTYLTIPIRIEDAYHSWGITSINEYFKLFICTEEFNTDSFNQEGLEMAVQAGDFRTAGRKRQLPRSDWAVKDIPLKIYRPLPPVRLEAGKPAQWFGHAFEAPAGFSAGISLNTLEKAAARFSAPPDLETTGGTLFQPQDLGPPVSLPELRAIELAGCSGAGRISAAAPLRIRLKTDAAGLPAIHLFSYQPETGKLYPVDFGVKDNELRVNKLPEPTPSVFGQSVKLLVGRVFELLDGMQVDREETGNLILTEKGLDKVLSNDVQAEGKIDRIKAEQVSSRYSELIDKKFLSGLSPEEDEELVQLENLLTNYESQFYGPIIKKLENLKNDISSEDSSEDVKN